MLFDYGVDTFFARLFDSLLGINQWEHLKSIKEKNVELRLNELTDIIKTRYEYKWEDLENISYESMYALISIWRRSRYGKYWNIVYLLLYVQRNLPSTERNKNCELLLTYLNKLFFIFSIRYDKAVIEVHTFMRNLRKKIVFDFLDSLRDVKEKITLFDDKSRTAGVLNNNIAYNARKKNLICLLSAFLDEKSIDINIKNMKKKLFETGFDIEHIYAIADEDPAITISADLQN